MNACLERVAQKVGRVRARPVGRHVRRGRVCAVRKTSFTARPRRKVDDAFLMRREFCRAYDRDSINVSSGEKHGSPLTLAGRRAVLCAGGHRARAGPHRHAEEDQGHGRRVAGHSRIVGAVLVFGQPAEEHRLFAGHRVAHHRPVEDGTERAEPHREGNPDHVAEPDSAVAERDDRFRMRIDDQHARTAEAGRILEQHLSLWHPLQHAQGFRREGLRGPGRQDGRDDGRHVGRAPAAQAQRRRR